MINRPERAAHFTIALIVLALCGVLTRIASGQESRPRRGDRGAVNTEILNLRRVGRGETRRQLPIERVEGPQLLTQVCWLEATYRHDDCAAIVHVLKRRAARAGWPVERMAWAYSALDSDTPRAKLAQRLPAELDAAELPQWYALAGVVEGALSGRVKSPCARADHWGARNLPRDQDRARKAVSEGRWRLLGCRTANAFYREVAGGERVLAASVAGGGR